ncbi:MAG: prepilin peptidase, partial [Candidatus Moranbacteria bacterium CG17_big_fil_post_rev_8_21_14_2_50_41_107]
MDFFFVFFLFGLLIGSFLNVLVYRLKDAETLLGRSFCRKCKHQIRWYDNIPLISFVLLRGECRDCQEKISWQYPVLECVT